MGSPPSFNNCDCSAVLSHLPLPCTVFPFWLDNIKLNLRKYNFTQKILPYESFLEKYTHNANISKETNSNSLISSTTLSSRRFGG